MSATRFVLDNARLAQVSSAIIACVRIPLIEPPCRDCQSPFRRKTAASPGRHLWSRAARGGRCGGSIFDRHRIAALNGTARRHRRARHGRHDFDRRISLPSRISAPTPNGGQIIAHIATGCFSLSPKLCRSRSCPRTRVSSCSTLMAPGYLRQAPDNIASSLPYSPGVLMRFVHAAVHNGRTA